MKAFLASMLMVVKFIISDVDPIYIISFPLKSQNNKKQLSLYLGLLFCFPFLSAVNVNGKGCLGFSPPFFQN